MKISRLAHWANPCGALYPRVPECAFSAGNPSCPPIPSVRRNFLGAFGVAIVAASAPLAAAAWNPNAETDVARYLVSYGTSPGDHPVTIDAGLDTSATLTGLQEGTTYYVVVTAV